MPSKNITKLCLNLRLLVGLRIVPYYPLALTAGVMPETFSRTLYIFKLAYLPALRAGQSAFFVLKCTIRTFD